MRSQQDEPNVVVTGVISTIVVMLFILFIYYLTKDSKPKQTNVKRVIILSYTVFNEKDYSYPGFRRHAVYLRLVVSEPPTRAELISTAEFEWKQSKNKYDEFTIFFYLNDQPREANAYARAMFDRKGLQEFNVLGEFY